MSGTPERARRALCRSAAPWAAALLALSACGEPPAGGGARPADLRTDASPPLPPEGWRDAAAPELAALIDRHAARLAERPDDAARAGTLGLVYRANGFLVEARAALARASELAPDDPVWVDQLADVTGELEGPGPALALLESGLARFPGHAPTRHRLGLLRLHQGRFEEARALFAQVADEAPGAAEGLLGLGAAELELGRPAEAREALLRALELAPDERAGHYLLGRALQALDDPGALAHLRRGRGGELAPLADDGDRRLGRFAVGLEHRRQQATRALASGRVDEAAAMLEALRSQHADDPRLALDLGVARSRQGQLEAALECFRSAVALAPDDHLTHANLAACLLDLGRADEALAPAQRAAELAPELAGGHVMRARAEALLGRTDAARASLARALELDPSDRLARRLAEQLAAPPTPSGAERQP